MPVDTFQKILDTAKRLFIIQGYTATSIRQIAEETGIGKATIYHHFKDKKEIILALFKNNTPDINNILNIIKSESNPKKRIELAMETSYKSFFKSADILQIIRREVPEIRNNFQTGFKIFMKDYINLLTDCISDGTKNGIFRKVDPQMSAKMLLTMLQGLFASIYLTGGSVNIQKKMIPLILDIYFHGIENK